MKISSLSGMDGSFAVFSLNEGLSFTEKLFATRPPNQPLDFGVELTRHAFEHTRERAVQVQETTFSAPSTEPDM